MEQLEKRALGYMLKHNDDVRDLGHHSHQECDVRVSQDALHDDLILDLVQELISQSRVKDLLDRDWRSI